MARKSYTSLLLLTLLIEYKSVACSEHELSPSSVATVFDFYEPLKITGKRQYRLWDLKGEIKALKREERRYAPFERLKNDFLEAVEEKHWKTASIIRDAYFFQMKTASIETLEHFYQSFPELFLSPESANPFLQASQEQIYYFCAEHGNDLVLMESILKACSSNNLNIPDAFFKVSDPRIALSHINFVKKVAPELLDKCHSLPDNLESRFNDGETVLTDALKQNNLKAVSVILQRSDASKLVNLRNGRRELPISLIKNIKLDLKLKEKLLRKFLNVANDAENDDEMLSVLDGYIEGSLGNEYLSSNLSAFISDLIKSSENHSVSVERLQNLLDQL